MRRSVFPCPEEHIGAFRLVLPTQTFPGYHLTVFLGVSLHCDGFYSGLYIFLILFPSIGSSNWRTSELFPCLINSSNFVANENNRASFTWGWLIIMEGTGGLALQTKIKGPLHPGASPPLPSSRGKEWQQSSCGRGWIWVSWLLLKLKQGSLQDLV